MARFEVSGIEAAQEAFLRRSERAAKAVPKMLKAGGAVLVKAEQYGAHLQVTVLLAILQILSNAPP